MHVCYYGNSKIRTLVPFGPTSPIVPFGPIGPWWARRRSRPGQLKGEERSGDHMTVKPLLAASILTRTPRGPRSPLRPRSPITPLIPTGPFVCAGGGGGWEEEGW